MKNGSKMEAVWWGHMSWLVSADSLWSLSSDHVTPSLPILPHWAASDRGQWQWAAQHQTITDFLRTLSQLSSQKIQPNNKKTVTDTSFVGLLTDYLEWRQYYVIWRPVASAVSWPQEAVVTSTSWDPGAGVTGDQEEQVRSEVTRVTRHPETEDRVRGWCLERSLAQDWDSVTGDWGRAPGWGSEPGLECPALATSWQPGPGLWQNIPDSSLHSNM